MRSAQLKNVLSLLLSLGYFTLSQGIFLKLATAQVVPDGTTSTTVDVDGTINNGDRAGSNLFHSFSDFSVPTGDSAFFNNAADIVNIFSRVTGGNISNIDGLLRANGSANLFLLNPAGILFGPNARLDIGGSFFSTTADSFLFEDGEFSATDLDNPPLLTINAPIGLNFRDNPGEITVRRDGLGTRTTNDLIDTENALRVSSTSTLGLVGGNLKLEGATLKTDGGRIELGSVTGNEQISFTPIDKGFSLGYEGVENFGDIQLSQTATVDASGLVSGDIQVRGNNITLTEGSTINASTLGNVLIQETPGIIYINATDTVILDGVNSDGIFSGIFAQVNSGAIGDGGNVTIDTASLTVSDAARISASTSGEGNAGDLTINASESVSLIDSRINADVNSGATGDGGNVTIDTASLTVSDAARISASTSGEGNAGDLTINASESVSLIDSRINADVNSGATGDGGNVTIDTASLTVSDGAFITASTGGEGDAGDLVITASELIEATGGRSRIYGGIFANTGFSATGNSGNITIDTASLTVSDGARIEAANFARIEGSNFGEGNGGNITINASESVSLSGAESLSSIGVASDGDFFPSGIFAQVGSGIIDPVGPRGTGNAGNITIDTASLTVTDGAEISAINYGEGDASDITITASESVSLSGERSNGSPSGISAQVDPRAIGNVGNVTIDTSSLTVTDGAQISASTFGEGNAGSVEITASDTIAIDGVTENNRSGILANAFISNGNSGNINVLADEITIDDGATIEAGNIDSFGDSNPGTGEPGNINIQANSLSLTNEARISAATQSETGDTAKITLQLSEDLTLKDNSFISARAFNKAYGGIIEIDSRFIVAFPSEGNGNDIIATAERGFGGNIQIISQGIFNLQEGTAIDENGNFIPNHRNDIDVSGEYNFIQLATDINKTEIAESLEVFNVDRLIAKNLCQRGDKSEFIVTGKGGMAPSPSEPRDGEISEVDLVEPAPFVEDREVEERGETPLEDQQTSEETSEETSEDSPLPVEEIVQAQGWIINEQGKVRLVAYKTDPNSYPTEPKNDQICNQ